MGLALSKLERDEEAITAYSEAMILDLSDDASAFNLGNLLMRLQKPKEAEVAYREATQRQPQASENWNNLGGALSKQEKDMEATEAYLEGLRHSPHDPEVRFNLARCFALYGSWDTARGLLESAKPHADPSLQSDIKRLLERIDEDSL